MMRRICLALLLLTTTHCARASHLLDGAGRGGAGGAPAQPAAGEVAAGGAGAAAGGGSGGNAGVPSLPALDAEALLMSSCRRLIDPAQLLPANILFVIDRSGSMLCNPPPITDSATCERENKRATLESPSKWEITRKALVESLDIAPEASRVGLSLFSNDQACGVYPDPSVSLGKNIPNHKELIDATMSAAKPGGPTPLVGGVILAYHYLHDLADRGLISGNTFVVLLTDGKQSESCVDPARCNTAEECTNLLIETEVPKAAAPGVSIRTFVIGVPGSEADQRTLSRIAAAGGTKRSPQCDPDRDCHFDVGSGGDFSGALRQALQNILGQTRSCDLPAPRPELGSLDLVNLLYKPQNGPRMVIPQDPKRKCDGGANGWQYAENNTRIRLCGDICQRVSADPAGELAVVLGCPVQGPQ